MSAAYCKCVVKDFVLGWERCMKIFNFEKFWVLPKRGLSTRSKWSWKLLSRVVSSDSSWGAVCICRFFCDCLAVKLFQLLRPLSMLWKISIWVERDVWKFQFLSKFWVLPKRGLSFGQNGHDSYWAELSPHEEQFAFAVSVVSSVIALRWTFFSSAASCKCVVKDFVFWEI